MNKQILALIAVVAVVVVGIVVFRSMAPALTTIQQKVEAPVDTGEGATSPTDGTMMSYTLEDVAKHSKAEDCWMVIEGNVYDMTPYIQKQIHPGGAAILFGCGKDATKVFNLRPKDNKPHSQNARDMLKDYYLGALTK
jgi:cytochrome b involved in lipid metabolism